ncbi:MAG: hypothetical protein ABI592_12980 [Acidobacteriota bacterium]
MRTGAIGLGAAAAAALAALLWSKSPAPPTAAPAAPAPAASASATEQPSRRVAVRAPRTVTEGAELSRFSEWARRRGIVLDTAGEESPVPEGSEVFRIEVVPASPGAVRRLARVGVTADGRGFAFDGRTYRAAGDAVAVRDPRIPRETLVLGLDRESAWRVAARGIFRREPGDSDYRVVSGELSKTGRLRVEASGALAVDRSADRDEIGSREEFLGSLATVVRDGVRWRFGPEQRPAVDRLERVLARFARKTRRAPLEIRVYPDAVMKARVTGSSRPADVSVSEGVVRVEVDASSPPEPDLVAPALAAAAYAAEDPRLAARPILLLALGARAAGRWWGRGVPGFAAFAARAGVAPTPRETMGGGAGPRPRRGAAGEEEADVSPVLAVGCAASWLETAIRSEGEAPVLAVLAGAEAEAEAALARWEAVSSRGAAAPPARRPLPEGFLRGVSYAMSNSIDAGYISPRSRETLARLSRLHVDAVSVMPFAFQRDPGQPSLVFVHRSPEGETDEGTLRAVADARGLGMTSMVKPQIWVGDGAFVGKIAMTTEADWSRWFDAYRRFIVHHAVVAEASGASLFCLGTELNGTETRPADWRRTIAAVRLATGAPLTYASNWVAGALRVPFWGDLDAIGVDFYDPPSADAAASDAVLESGVRAAALPLARLSRAAGKPVLFTEAGFPLSRASWIAPHDENSGRPASGTDCARGIDAMFRALGKEPWWKGVYWWKAFSSGREALADERGFNVLGGAAEHAVADGFARIARERGK